MASFIAYRCKDSQEREYFLQMRDGNAPRHANIYSLFGGEIEEGESIEKAMIREIQEELEYRPTRALYFSQLETASARFFLFIEEVKADFESRIVVHEGEYGSFLSWKDILQSDCVSPIARVATEGMEWYLEK